MCGASSFIWFCPIFLNGPNKTAGFKALVISNITHFELRTGSPSISAATDENTFNWKGMTFSDATPGVVFASPPQIHSGTKCGSGIAVRRAPAAAPRIFKLERLKDCRLDSYSKD